MSFVYPLGLLGLIGIPILIAIYIIKTKYTEQTVASTYLWSLSERFIRRRNPISKVAGIISLILQMLTVALISLAIAHPVITIPGGASSYVFVLDGSGSMSYSDNGGKTRFELARDKVSDVIESSPDGSRYTLIYAGASTEIIYEGISDREEAVLKISELSITHCAADLTESLDKVKSLAANSAIKAYLVTDKDYSEHENVELIRVGKAAENYGLSSHVYSHVNGKLTVSGQVISYESDAALEVELFLNESTEASSALTLDAMAGQSTDFSFEIDAEEFRSARVVLKNTDSLPLDNECTVYNLKYENSYSTLIVSDTPFFLETVLGAVSSADVRVIPADAYNSDIKGYGLYIFDGVAPEVMPKDGAVWFINVGSSIEGSGFSVQGDVPLDDAEEIQLTKNTASLTRKLINGLKGENIFITDYIKCGLYKNFTTIYSYRGVTPLVFTGVSNYGNREVVFAFDIHKSNFALTTDFILLAKNLLDYSFPAAIEDTLYECGERAEINVISGCESIRVESPSGNVSYLSLGSAVAELPLSEVGSYKVIMSVSGSNREYSIWSAFPEEERDPLQTAEQFSYVASDTESGLDAYYDDLTAVMIAIALLFTADWVVYCYEKYQLR